MASSAPSWQVDIPGLSQLVFNVGAHGLKQLASAGVDIHTVGCMLMVSELVPACPEFRKSLNAARHKQRKEKTWLYNLVEIGASTSFLVEQFLKTRAGENVLALMTAVAPLMSPEACPLLLNHLFEDSEIAPENTPGMQQFAKLRDGLIEFTRLVGFREKVMHQYEFLLRLAEQRSDFAQPRDIAPYDAIPSVASLSRILQACHTIAAAEHNCVLYVKGFTGSAWIAAYACHILKLPTCAIDGSGRRIPMTEQYGEAEIVICPCDDDDEETKLDFYTVGALTEVIVPTHLDRDHCRGWSVSCDDFNYLEFRHPEISSLRLKQTISSFVANAALDEAAYLASPPHLFSPGLDTPGIIPYLASMLPQIRQRCLQNLSILGFGPLPVEKYDIDTSSRDHYCSVSQLLLPSELLKDQQTPWGEKSTELFNLYRRECAGSGIIDCVHTDEAAASLKAKFLGTLINSILIASHLAFTDWNLTLRTLSSRFIWSGSDLAKKSIDINQPSSYRLSLALNAVFDSVDFGGRLWSSDVMALDLDRVIIVRQLETQVSLSNVHGILFSLVPGRLYYQDQSRKMVVCEKDNPDFIYPGYSTVSEPDIPRDIVPNLRSRYLIHSLGETLYIKQEIFDGKWCLYGTALPDCIARRLMEETYVTTPCDCEYYKPLSKKRLKRWRHAPEFDLGFFIGRSNLMHRNLELYYQMVENNPLGQWCSAQAFTVDSPVTIILQRGACLDCIFTRLEETDPCTTRNLQWRHGRIIVIVPIGAD